MLFKITIRNILIGQFVMAYITQERESIEERVNRLDGEICSLKDAIKRLQSEKDELEGQNETLKKGIEMYKVCQNYKFIQFHAIHWTNIHLLDILTWTYSIVAFADGKFEQRDTCLHITF